MSSEKAGPVTLFAMLVTAGLAGVVLWLAGRLVQAGRARAAARAGFFDTVAGALQNVTRRIEPSGFARLAGDFQDARFDLQAVPDSLTFRKLPVLWVLVTLTDPIPVGTEVHIMARPGQSDIFSTFDKMPVSVALPPGFPAFCALRCTDAAGLPDTDLLMGLAPLFDGSVKELVISPKGLRLVILADEADRGAYLLFREAELGQQPLDQGTLAPLLQTLLDLQSRLRTQNA